MDLMVDLEISSFYSENYVDTGLRTRLTEGITCEVLHVGCLSQCKPTESDS